MHPCNVEEDPPFSPTSHENAESKDVSMREEQQQQSQQGQVQVQSQKNNNNPRACRSCRVSKVKCDQPKPDMPCVRCQKLGKACVDAESQPGKRQRQFNDRMVEIESRIESILLSAGLQDSAGESPLGTTSPLCSPSGVSHDVRQHGRNLAPFNGTAGMEDLKSSIQSWLDDNTTDLDDRTTETMFSRYLSNMASRFPVVVFPPGTTAADVRSANPVLFLAILDVASSGFCALETQRKLRKLIVQVYVHCMLRSEQYTLGLLQALIVSATWYRTIEPVEPGEQMDIYQISHTAANMALIMRLGESLTPRGEKGKGTGCAVQAGSLPARRVWLGCHYICSNTAMSLRAPNVMRWTRLMDECLEVLETSPAALPSDRLFCQHIRLQHITEEYAMHLSAVESFAADKSQMIQVHRAFKGQLNEWRGSVTEDWDESLEFSYYFSRLYINEVAHCTATSDDVDIPSDDTAQGPPPIVLIEPHAATEFMEAIDNIFQIFTSLDMSTIRALPATYLIRIIYTFLILVKLHFAAAKLPTQDATALQVDRLQVFERLNQLIQMTAGWGPLWPATKLTTVFVRMRSWLESGGESNCQRGFTGWEFRFPSDRRGANVVNMAEEASDVGSIVPSGSRSLYSTDVDPLAFSLEPPLGTDLMAPPPFESVFQATESCFPQKDAPGLMQEDVPLAAGHRLRDLPNIDIDQMETGMDWSEFPNMGFDLSNLDMSFSSIPPPLPDFGPDAATRDNFSDQNT